MKINFIFYFIVLSPFFIAQNINSELGIKPYLNFIQFGDKATANQLKNWLDNSSNEVFTVVHFGDSHIQAEGPTSVVRNKLQSQYGDAGRGMMFPYSAANSYTSILYSSSHKGEWSYSKSFQFKPKLKLGVSGMTIRTTDNHASVSMILKNPSLMNQKARLYLDIDSSSYDVLFIADSDSTLIRVSDFISSKNPYIEIPLKGKESKFTLQVIQESSRQNHFEFYGLSLESVESKGVRYHSVGVGASQYGSMLVEPLLVDQLPSLNPSLIILDFGTNNYLYDNIVRPELGPEIEKIIRNLRSYCPKALILLTSTQDLYYKSKHITSGIIFRNLIDSLADKNNCLFWDWYAISGGKKSLLKWKDAGYAQTDLIHLTTKGYQLKGELLFNAIINTLDTLSKNSELREFKIPYREVKDVTPSTTNIKVQDKVEEGISTKPPTKLTNPKSDNQTSVKGRVHIVKKGDTLSEIANRYHSNVSQIKKTNNLKSDKIQIGQKLIIP